MNGQYTKLIWILVFFLTGVMSSDLSAQSHDEIVLINNNIVCGKILRETDTEVTIQPTEIFLYQGPDDYRQMKKEGDPITFAISYVKEINRGSSTEVTHVARSLSPNKKDVISLNLDAAVEIAMGNSYRIRQLELGIERTRALLKSRRAGLKSRVYMRLNSPEIKAVSERLWNSTIKKYEVIHENTRLWQADLSIRQPVVLFGFPTNGYLSLNNRTYKYLQKDGDSDVDYYNRFFVRFEQPFLQPNSLKNNIEDAELDLKQNELDYVRDRVRLIDDVGDDYYDLFDVLYRNLIYSRNVQNLERIERIVGTVTAQDSSRSIESAQVQVELANAREMLLKNNTDIRREEARLKQRLRLDHQDSVYIEPTIKITPIEVNVDQAIRYGFSLAPSLQRLEISKRKNEIDVDNSKGWDSFRISLEVTYGLENTEDRFEEVWEDFDRSHSVSLSAYVPIWDWGRRKARMQATRVNLQRTELYIEETRNNIRSNIINAVDNLQEMQQRVLNLRSSAGMVQEITEFGIKQYQEGAIRLQNLLRMAATQQETELNFLTAYLGYRQALMSLTMQTYYDYENDISLLDKFRLNS